MTNNESGVSRRAVLLGGLAAGGALLAGRGGAQPAAAATEAPAITAAAVARVPDEPDDPAWQQAAVATVQLFPQNMVVPRLLEAGAKQVQVRALYDGERLALLVEWNGVNQDTQLGTVSDVRDGAAIQFPEDPTGALPPFTMGVAGSGVTIYHWKSDWQFARTHDVDEAYPNMYADLYQFSGKDAGEIPEATDYLLHGRKEFLTAAAVGNTLADPLAQEAIGPVQKMRAEGFGSLEPHATQDAAGKGQWQEGTWRVLFSVPRQQDKFTFSERAVYNLAFAAWEGARRERNGQKAYSTWQSVGLEPWPAGLVAAPPAGSAAAARQAQIEATRQANADPGALVRGNLPVIGGAAAVVGAALAGLVHQYLHPDRESKDEGSPPDGDAQQ